jgi:hypothetical protein
MTEGIYTSYTCNNYTLIANAAALFFQDGWTIADVTYGKGVFWRSVDVSKYIFHPSDIMTCPDTAYDFKHLPYEDASHDVVVFDPPYAHNPGRMIVNDNYQNAETTKGFYHKDIMQLYYDGMKEAYRVLKVDGLLLVKCKDEIESSLQKMSHIEIYNYAVNVLEMIAEDLFILTQKNAPVIQFKKQQHARKNHSYLWIFRKRN